MIVALPWPDQRLSPNARVYWRALAPIKKAARELACALTYNAMHHGVRDIRMAYAAQAEIPIKITIIPPNHLRRDRDNMTFQCSKFYLDGIADALGVNDCRFRPSYEFAAPCKPGGVEFVL